MANFDVRRRGYDPALRPYRIGVYVVFWGVLVYLLGALTWSIVAYLLK